VRLDRVEKCPYSQADNEGHKTPTCGPTQSHTRLPG
jgi:hypothetical protein